MRDKTFETLTQMMAVVGTAATVFGAMWLIFVGIPTGLRKICGAEETYDRLDAIESRLLSLEVYKDFSKLRQDSLRDEIVRLKIRVGAIESESDEDDAPRIDSFRINIPSGPPAWTFSPTNTYYIDKYEEVK